ncbi:hypothetical protein AB0O82_13805 [Kitasatospora sp. NPDC088264]|uniref:hypothetical protein n=1 Tax=Kitasatospora sp. NPDC088264 TaxID=3155296 RepID=UPI00343E702A
MPTALVYVPAPSQANLKIGIQRSLWGWRAETVARGRTDEVLAGLSVGDFLLLGHRGPNARVAPGGWAHASLKQLVVARIAGDAFVDTEPVWPDDTYPHRIRLDVLDIQTDVDGSLLGEQAMEALRLSANKQGAPVLQDLTVIDNVINALVQDTPTTLTDLTAPGDTDQGTPDRYLEIDGELDQRTQTLVRREQQRLRREKFKLAERITCALCGTSLPGRVVHTAHIKRRRDCDIYERRDLANVMGACVLGCDVLFEHGYLYVSEQGIVTPTPAALNDPGLKPALTALSGRHCTEFTDASGPYFAWHRSNIALVAA